MKKNKISKTIFITALMLAGFSDLAVLADTHNQTDGAKTSVETNAIFGKYYAIIKMTNNINGGVWVKPDTNIVVSSGTLTDISGFPPPYASYAYVIPFGKTNVYFGSNSVTFPATNTLTYSLTVYVTSPTPPPTNGQPMSLQVTWTGQ